MGRQIYLSDNEIKALCNTCTEWCSIMGEGEDTFKDVDIRLDEGLGSALYKLHKGTFAENIYNKYK